MADIYAVGASQSRKNYAIGASRINCQVAVASDQIRTTASRMVYTFQNPWRRPSPYIALRHPQDGLQSFIEDDDLILRGAFTQAEAEKRKGSGLYSDSQLATMVDQSKRNLISIQNKAASEEQRRALRRQRPSQTG